MTRAAHAPDAKLRRGIRQSVQSYLGGFGSKANMNLCTASADISLPGFQGPTMEILTPPSDHIPLRRRCAFGGQFHTKRPRLAGCKGRGRWRPGSKLPLLPAILRPDARRLES